LIARWARFWFSPARTLAVNTPARHLPDALPLRRTDRVLDVGCGCAGLLIYLHHRVRLEQPLEGLDASPFMVEWARRELEARHLAEHIHVQVGGATNLPFPDRTFDAVLSTYVIKHLPDPELRKLLQEVRRVLKPGGAFCLWEAAPSRLEFLHSWHMKLLRIGEATVKLRSPAEVRGFLQEAGFVRLRPFGEGHRYLYYPPLRRTGFLANVP
jgi:ubiquinone/menaquinone biosynthesis C-methylase UbiE